MNLPGLFTVPPAAANDNAPRHAAAYRTSFSGDNEALFNAADAICFTRGRIRFESPTKALASPAMGQIFTYFGPRPERFTEVFGAVGNLMTPRRCAADVGLLAA